MIVLFSCLLLLALYQKSVKVDLSDLYYGELTVQKLLVVNAGMKAEMLMLMQGQSNHFDTITQSALNSGKLFKDLNRELGDVEELESYFLNLRKSLAYQGEPLERFKMKLGVLKNSMRYLPTLLMETAEAYPKHSALLMFVYRELLLISLHPAEYDTSAIQSSVQYSEGEEFKNINNHLELVLQYYAGVEEAMREFSHSGVKEAAENLDKAAHVWFDEEIKDAEKYGFLLLVYSVFLLIFIVFVLWRLQLSNRELKESNSFLRDLRKALDDHAIVSIADQEGDITYVNDKFCAISGYSREDLMGKNHRVIKSDEHTSPFFGNLWAKISSGETWQGLLKNRTKGGGFYWVNSTITPFLDEKGKPWQYVSIRTDITEQILAEQTLKESHERYRVLSEMIPFALGLVQGGHWVYVNQAAILMFGALSEEDLLGKKVLDFVALEDREEMSAKLPLAGDRDSAVPLQEVRLLSLAKKPFDAEIQGSMLSWSGENTELLIMHDISERKKKEAEYQLYSEQLEHTQRLESLGVLAGGIAHDFNNILTSIMGNISLAEESLDDPDKTKQYLDKLNSASDRAADLCQQMLSYSGGGVIEKKPVVLVDLFNDVVEMTSTVLKDQVKLEKVIAPELPAIIADERQIQQVMLNLLTNAGEAIVDKGLIRAELGVMNVDERVRTEVLNGQSISLGEYVFFEVQDAGVGMDQATKTRIFDPFFTTKFTGRGLGLSATMGIINTHGGAVSLNSEPGVGTTIRVLFPATSEIDTRVKIQKNDPMAELKGSGTILVIDDEAGILGFVRDALSRSGFDVITAEDGQEGIALFDEHKDELVGVICDLVMPKLGGVGVAKYIHEQDSDIHIILSSGYDEDDVLDVPDGVLSGFIHKPYRLKPFLAAVHRALGTKN